MVWKVELRRFAVAQGVTDPDAEAWAVKTYKVQRFGNEYMVEVEVMIRFDDHHQVGLTVYDGTYEMVWLIIRQPRCRSVYWEVYDDGKVRML